MEAKQVTLRDYSLSFSDTYRESQVNRDNVIDDIVDLLDKDNKILILDGTSGIGKTNVLQQFAQRFCLNSITYFINYTCNITSRQDYLMEDMGRQIFYYVEQEAPSKNLVINEKTFHELLLSLMKIKQKNPVYFIIDGLDQIPKVDADLLKPILNNLPWNTNNFYFILSGEPNSIKDIIGVNTIKSFKQHRVPRLSLDETCKFFSSEKKDEEYVRELYQTWKGKPEELEEIRTILNSGTTLKDFVENDDIRQKQELLEKIWLNSKLENLDLNNLEIQVISLITFNDITQNVDKISDIIGASSDEIKLCVDKINFLDIRDNNINFISRSFRSFLTKKLRKYETKISNILIDYYTRIDNADSIKNLPTLYERNDAWANIIDILTPDNIETIVTNSESFSEIKKQINYGYKASENLNQSFGNLFNFSLYRSTINELQKSDNRESQIKACIALGEKDRAFSLVSNGILKEDKLKMLIIYAKECKNEKIEVEENILEEIQNLVRSTDKEYITENVVDIVTGIAYFLPETAVQIIEDVSGLSSENNSLEWLMAYVGTIIKSKSNNSNDKISIKEAEDKFNNVLYEKFSKSLGLGISEISQDEIINYVNDLENVNDKLFIIRKWIRKHKKINNIVNIIEYAFDLLIQSSSNLKPTTTVLLDIISPLPYMTTKEELYVVIGRIDELTMVINSPTNDKIRIERIIIESLMKYDSNLANNRYIALDNFTNNLSDYSVKLEALADCWALIKQIEKKYNIDEFISTEKDARNNILTVAKSLLSSTAEHYDEVSDTLEILAKLDLEFSLEIAYMLNVSIRRDKAISKCLENYFHLDISTWSVEEVKKATNLINDTSIYTHVVLSLFDAAINQKKKTRNNINKIVSFLPLIDRIETYSAKSYIITEAIVLLNLEPDREFQLKANYSKLISKLDSFLIDFWNKIDIPWHKIDIGYNITSKLAKYNRDIAKEYFSRTESIVQQNLITSELHSFSFINSIRLLIRAYCGLLEIDKLASYDKIGSLIKNLPSDIERVRLWSELALKAKFVNSIDISSSIVTKEIIPLLEEYKAKSDNSRYYSILESCASAVQAYQPESLKLYLDKLSKDKQENIIRIVCYTIITKCHETDPYNNRLGSHKFKFQEATEYINLLEYLETDSLIFSSIRKLCYLAKERPTSFTREQKTAIFSKLSNLVNKKLPNNLTGVSHNGFSIVARACLQNYMVDTHQQNKFYNEIESEVLNIDNIADRSLVYAILAEECDNKKKKTEFVSKSFEEADKILSLKEKADQYEQSLEICKAFSKDIFNDKIRIIYDEIHQADEKDMFPTSRRLVDIAYKHDKSLAQKLISSLDNDPGRKRYSETSSDYYESLELEKSAMSDYSQLNRVKNRSKIADIAFEMLGEINGNKRNSREISNLIPLIRTASRMPFYYSMPVFEFFIQNVVKNEDNSKRLLVNIFDAAHSNAKLCYNMICSISDKKSNLHIMHNSDNNDSCLVLPGNRDKAIEFIGKKIKLAESKEIYIIDPYFSQSNISFLKQVSEWSFGSKITIITSTEDNNDFSRFSFVNAWEKISAEEPPHINVISATTTSKKSPLHDRWIIMFDKLQGLNLGTSIKSIGDKKVHHIHTIYNDEVKDVYNSVVIPLAIEKVRDFENHVIKYEIFDM